VIFIPPLITFARQTLNGGFCGGVRSGSLGGGSLIGGFSGLSGGSSMGGGIPGDGGGPGGSSGSLIGGFLGRLGGSSTGGFFCNRISFARSNLIPNSYMLTFYLFKSCL
jgi:hypothetical protein